MIYSILNYFTKLTSLVTVFVVSFVSIAFADGHVTLRMSTPASATDQRSIALEKVFAPAVANFAKYEPHYNASLIKQNSELEAIASGDLEMSITSAQELSSVFSRVFDFCYWICTPKMHSSPSKSFQ